MFLQCILFIKLVAVQLFRSWLNDHTTMQAHKQKKLWHESDR